MYQPSNDFQKVSHRHTEQLATILKLQQYLSLRQTRKEGLNSKSIFLSIVISPLFNAKERIHEQLYI